MPVTKKQKAQLDQKVVTDEDIAEDKPQKAKEREERRDNQSEKEELQKALKDLLIRLGSRDIDDLKQMTFMSLKIRDPLAKGMAYYDSTLPTIEAQCNELLDWYIIKCQSEIVACKEYIDKLNGEPQELEKAKTELTEVANTLLDKVNAGASPNEINALSDRMEQLEKSVAKLDKKPTPTIVLKNKTFEEKIFGVKKIKTTPELEVFDAEKRLSILEARLVELNKIKAEAKEVNTAEMYFKKWAYNYLLNCRSQLGEDNFLKMMVMLTDGQIINKQDAGSPDFSKVFSR